MIKKRHVHDLSSYKLRSIKAGKIVPINVVECLPNDTFMGRSEAIIRIDPTDRPVMHPLRVRILHYFCPTRLVWPDWHKFITQGKYGSTPPVHPYFTVGEAQTAAGGLLNCLGITPLSGVSTRSYSAIPLAVYNKICNTFHIDQDLATPLTTSEASGDRTGLENLDFCDAGWKKDYFTTARPWAQKSVSVPIPQSNIISDGNTLSVKGASSSVVAAVRTNSTKGLYPDGALTDNEYVKYDGGLEMDDSATVVDSRLANSLQRFFENRVDQGSTFIEYLRRAFGSKVYDSQLQNPELVNWSEQTVKFSEVLQTAEGSDPVGTLRGHGVGGLGSNTFKYYIKEHGYWMTLAYIMPEPIYGEAMERFWMKSAFTDYWQEEFEAVGQQPVWNAEIYGALFESDNPKGTWGYADRYGEYMRSLHDVRGGFALPAQDNWHMARFFGSVPTLNNSFITGAPTQRIFADTEATQPYQMMTYHRLIARRVVKRHVIKRIM